MDQYDIPKLLRALPIASHVGAPPGHTAILRRDVIESPADLTEIERWIRAHGGAIIPAPEPILSGRAQWRTESSREALAFVVPTECLE